VDKLLARSLLVDQVIARLARERLEVADRARVGGTTLSNWPL
jgi:hypothetical protein